MRHLVWPLSVFTAAAFTAGLVMAQPSLLSAFNAPDLSGSWEICDDVNALLGYSGEGGRKGAVATHPPTFRITHIEAPPKEVDARIETVIGPRAFDGAKVTLVKWESDFHQDEEVDPTSFLVRHEGRTSLFSGTFRCSIRWSGYTY